MPAAPGGFPHLSDADDVYKGYTIHGGTMVIPNIWAMQHNPAQFPDPLVFNPERFLPSSSTQPDHQSRPSVKPEMLSEGHYGFGFGRRACPGKHLASKTIWIGVTRMMWAFEIGYKVDEKGERVGVVDTERCTSGITS
jgi:cytochrome P450